MYPVTIRDRILAHLYRYRRYSTDTYEGSPIEITQEGIGNAIGISRSHACVALTRMIESGEVEIFNSTVKGSRRMVKRKLYHITELGKKQYLKRADELRTVGIDLENLGKDINECSFDDISRLSKDRFDDIGCLLVLRTEVCRNDVDPDLPLVGFKSDGSLNIKAKVRESMFRGSSDDDIRRWHSKAADWCMDRGRPSEERIYHLILSGRDWEAMNLIRKDRFRLMDIDDTELSGAVSILARRHGDKDVLAIGTRMALNNGLLDDAESLSGTISSTDPVLGGRLMSEVLVRKGDLDRALELARSSCGSEPDSGITLGLCLLRKNLPEEASECLGNARIRMVESGCLYRMDELLLYEATAEMELHHMESAVELIRTGLSVSRNKRLKDGLSELERLISEHGVVLQGVDI